MLVTDNEYGHGRLYSNLLLLQSTNFGLKVIKDTLRSVACQVGIEHHGWYNPGSTWYGEARRVRHLAKLTVALTKFGRATIFGPGTHCRCAHCVKPPKECGWGKGLYPGVMLLYMQEIAVNAILTESEWWSLPSALLDQDVTNPEMSVCGAALLHVFHHEQRFNKFAFDRGEYNKFNMSSLDITNVRDFATYIALVSNGQGEHGDIAIKNFKHKTNSTSLAKYCYPQR